MGDLIDVIQEYDPKAKTWGTFGKLPYPAKSQFSYLTIIINYTYKKVEMSPEMGSA